MKKNRFPLVPGVCFAFFVLAFSALSQTLEFNATVIPGGNGPEFILPIDVNGSGHPGIVMANFGFFNADFSIGGGYENSLSLYTNDDSGNLYTNATITVGNSPVGLAVADVNNDGYDDIVCCNVSDDTISILTNNFRGGFVFSANLPTGDHPSLVTLADVNGDGWVDVIAANYSSGTLSVFTNTGDGNFVLSQTVTVGDGPTKVAAADLNGSGRMDLLCANAGDNTVSILTNNGVGIFKQSSLILVTNGVGWLGAADVNRDGKVDLVTLAGGYGIFTVYTNTGAGGFKIAHAFTNVNAGMFTFADMNDDGLVDIICNNNNNGIQGSTTVLTNNGKGQFFVNFTTPVGYSGDDNYPNFVTTADFDHDGNQDIAVSDYGGYSFTQLTQTGVPAKPIIVIAAPLDDEIITAGDGFTFYAYTTSTNQIDTMIFYLDGKSIGFANSDPFLLEVTNTSMYAAGAHGLQVQAIDSQGRIGWSPETQVNFTGPVKQPTPPTIKITSPANGATISASADFTMAASVSVPSDTTLGQVYFYEDDITNSLAQFVKAPFKCPIYAGNIPVGKHALIAVAYDLDGGVAVSEVVVTIKAGAATSVTLTSPTNGQSFVTSDAITLKATTKGFSSDVSVGFLVDNTNVGGAFVSPFTLTLPANTLKPGTHTIQAIAAASVGANASSSVVTITVNPPGLTMINFDALNTLSGAVSGTALLSYLKSYGVTVSNLTLGSTLEALNQSNLTGNVQAFPSSAPNFFTQAGLSGPVSFTLLFSQPLGSFEFTRVALSTTSGLLSHPAWTATAYDTNGDELSSISQPLILTNASAIPAQTFALIGDGITSVTFTSDSEGLAAFPAILLDNLVLNGNAGTNVLSVVLSVTSPPTNDIVAPATINLSATVNDAITTSYSVSFFAGLDLLATISSPPYDFTWTNVLPGHDILRAEVTDSTGVSARSVDVPIVVLLEPDSTLINFEGLPTHTGPVEGTPVRQYLAKFGVQVSSITSGTMLAVERQRLIAGGKALNASSGSNVLTQVGPSGTVEFTLSFTNQLLTQFGFTRPELLANPVVSFPAWRVTAFDASGAVVDELGRNEIDSGVNVGLLRHSLRAQPGGPGIAEVKFASMGTALTTFNAIVVDDLILTTNPSPFAPAVAITKPQSGVTLAGPPSVSIAASASDSPNGVNGAGIVGVSFYETQIIVGANSFTFLLSNVTTAPYKIDWNPGARPGSYIFTAVASNFTGLTWTSAPVVVNIAQPATQFGILTPPASQTVPAGGSASFAVTTTGTNNVTYTWQLNGVTLNNSAHISGATLPTLVINPPISDADAGKYTVTATSANVPGYPIPATASLTVIDPPGINPQPQGATVTPGTTVTLSPGATGIGPFTWQWLLNGSAILGATNRVYSILAAQPLQSGSYQVSVANQAASTLSVVAPVVVTTPQNVPLTNDNFENAAVINPLLGPVAEINTGATTESGEPDPLPGYAPSESVWFTWKPDFTGTVSLTTLGSDFDSVLAVYTGTKLTKLKPIAADDDSGGFLTSLVTFNVISNTLYQIAVDGFQGASGRIVLGFPAGNGYRILNPSSGDSVPIIVKQPASKVVALNSTATLSVGAASATKMTYQWTFEGAPIAGATGSSLTISHFQPGSVGSYQVLVINQTGSVQSELASLQIANDSGVTPTLAQNKFGDGGATTPAKAAFNLTPLAAGGDTRGFTVSQVFSTEGATAEPGEPQPCGQVCNGSQWFTYQTQIGGTLEIDTSGSEYNTLLGVYTGNGSSFSNLDEVGCGFSTNFEAEGQPRVTLTGVPAGRTFYIIVDGYQGATGLAQLHIGLGSPLLLSNTPANLLATAGSNVVLKVGVMEGSIPGSYDWQLNGVDLPGGAKSEYIVTNAQVDAIGNYSVIVSNVLGVVTSSPPTALNLQYIPLILSGPTNKTVALGASAKFSVTTLGVNVKTNPFHVQWYSGTGVEIPKATSLSYTLSSTHWSNNGSSFYVVISNSYGAVTSAPATLTLTDTAAPTLSIKSPRNNFITTTNPITISGTASDRVGILTVLVENGGSPFFHAIGSNNWSYSADLAVGVNGFTIRAVDLANNLAQENLTITYKPETAAKAMALGATPLGWAGTYGGLFYPPSGASQANAGFLTATIGGERGVFSGNILLDGGSYPFAGQFDASGNAQSQVARAGQSPLTAALHINDASLNGQISDGSWISVLTALRAGSGPVASLNGRYAVVIPSDLSNPVGYLTISGPGATAQVTGTFARANVLRSAPVTSESSIPLYLPFYSGGGLFLGWINPTTSSQAIWIKPGASASINVEIIKQPALNSSSN